MKILVLLVISAFTFDSFAADVSLLPTEVCTVTEVADSSFFEESLSVDEYPKIMVTVDENSLFTATLGSSLYSTLKGDIIYVTDPLAHQIKIEADHGYEEYLILGMDSSSVQKIQLLGRTRDKLSKPFSDNWTVIAEAECK